MALTKELIVDKIEIVAGTDEDGNTVNHVQVRTATRVLEDGEVLSSSYHRHVVSEGDDYSNEDAKVQAVCAAVFTS